MFEAEYRIDPIVPKGKAIQVGPRSYLFHSREDVFRFVYWGRLSLRLAAIFGEAAKDWEIGKHPDVAAQIERLHEFGSSVPFRLPDQIGPA